MDLELSEPVSVEEGQPEQAERMNADEKVISVVDIRQSGNIAGYEYEQILSSMPDLSLPVINNVRVEPLSSNDGDFRMTLLRSDYSFDQKGSPFLFFFSEDVFLDNYEISPDGTVSITFNVKRRGEVVIGLGDGLGQVAYKCITPEGEVP
jgi:hypothetical protein